MTVLPKTGMKAVAAAALSIIVFMVTTTMARKLGMACESTYCLEQGFEPGLGLFLAVLALGVFGHSILLMGRQDTHRCEEFKPATAATLGLLILVVYSYLRSLFNHAILDIPITPWEIFLLMGITTGVGFWGRAPKAPAVDIYALTVGLTLVFALCIVIAAREMPRDVMLSSDPDQHAFFAKQIERFGAIPYQQREWGSEGFNYPAATGVVLFLWHLLTGIDVRSLLTALAVLFTAMAALIMAESAAAFAKGLAKKSTIKLGALLLMLGAWNFPHYPEFFHMEGYGRQLSILFSALFLSLCVSYLLRNDQKNQAVYLFFGLILFVQTVLNPANVVVPASLLFFLFVHQWLKGTADWKLPLAGVLGFALLPLEPYFQGLLNIVEKARVDTVSYSDALVIKNWGAILNDTWLVITDHWARTLNEMSVILFETSIPLFVPLLACLGVILIAVRPSLRPPPRTWLAFFIFFSAFFIVYSFARSLADDRRFYLLGAYVFFSMAHYKALVLVLMTCTLLAVMSSLSIVRFLMLSSLLFGTLLVSVRHEQGLALEIRKNRCGAYECIPPEDKAFLSKLEELKRRGGLTVPGVVAPKVLVPNSLNQMDKETWIFPVSSARLLPYYDILPAAFFYFQGDPEYSAHSYAQHVCNQLDRAWLKQKGIYFVYLPSQRADVCIKDLDRLPFTEDIVLQEGNAYLIRLRH